MLGAISGGHKGPFTVIPFPLLYSPVKAVYSVSLWTQHDQSLSALLPSPQITSPVTVVPSDILWAQEDQS